MAPECITQKEYSRATDSWAFGVLIFEVVCCAEPYEGLTPLQVNIFFKKQTFINTSGVSASKVATKVANKNLRLELPDEASEELRVMVRQCCDFSPDNRPTFDELCDRLDATASLFADE